MPPDLSQWDEGPLPLEVSQADGAVIKTDKAERLLYFSHRVTDSIYNMERRMWKVVEGGFLEVLLPLIKEDRRYLFALHQSLKMGQDLEAIAEGVGAMSDRVSEVVAGAASTTGDAANGRTFTMVFGLIDSHAPSVVPTSENSEWSLREQYAWRLATLSGIGSSATPPSNEIENLREVGSVIDPASELTILVHHDGAAIIGTSVDFPVVDPFVNWDEGLPCPVLSMMTIAELEVHSLFVDCFLIGMLQRSGLNSIADRFASLASHRPSVSEMIELEGAFAEFKAAVWWHQISEERTANQVLRAFQREYGLDDLLSEVGRDMSHYAGQVQTLSSVRSSAAITMLSFTLFPLTVLLYLIQALIPATAGFYEKLGAYVASVPIALLIGAGVVALIPGYMAFLRDVIRPRASTENRDS